MQKTMEQVSKIRLRLLAAVRKNSKWQQGMSEMPVKIGIIGRTPVVDGNSMPPGLQVVPMTRLHEYVGSYYGRIIKTLEDKGIIARKHGMWKLREDLQDKGLAVYVTGRMGCFYRFYLSWTPQGVEYVKGIMEQRIKG